MVKVFCRPEKPISNSYCAAAIVTLLLRTPSKKDRRVYIYIYASFSLYQWATPVRAPTVVHNLFGHRFGNRSYFDHKVSESLLSSNSTQENSAVYSFAFKFFSHYPHRAPLQNSLLSGVIIIFLFFFFLKTIFFLSFCNGLKIDEESVVRDGRKKKKFFGEKCANSIRAQGRKTTTLTYTIGRPAFECREIP